MTGPIRRSRLARRVVAAVGILALTAACSSSPSTGAYGSAPATAAGSAGPAASGDPSSVATGAGGTVTVSQYSAPSGFHVLTAADRSAYQDIALMFAGLTRLNDKLEVIPELAESWDISDDGLTYTFHLDPAAKWQDGEPVTSADVVFTYNLVANPTIGASSYSSLKSIKGFAEVNSGAAETVSGIQAVDDQTVTFNLAAPDTAFLSNISKSVFRTNTVLPEHLLGDVPVDQIETNEFWNKPVGAGPYQFVSYQNGQYLELKAFDGYVLGRPEIDQAFVRFGNQDVLLAQLQRGEVDFAEVAAPEFETASEAPGIDVLESSSITFQAIYPNNLKPYLQDVRVRKALVYAIDRQAMVTSLLLGHGETVLTPIAAPEWAVNDQVTDYPYDPEKAKQLLAEAGWDPNQRLQIRLGTGNVVREKEAPVIQQYLSQVGIQSDIVTTDFPTLVQDMQAGNFDLALVGHLSGNDPDYTSIWSATTSAPPAGNNFPRYSNAEVDQLLQEGRQTVDQDERKTIYDRYQEIIVDEVAMVWLFRANDIYGVSERIKGFQPGPGADPFWNISEWSVS